MRTCIYSDSCSDKINVKINEYGLDRTNEFKYEFITDKWKIEKINPYKPQVIIPNTLT